MGHALFPGNPVIPAVIPVSLVTPLKYLPSCSFMARVFLRAKNQAIRGVGKPAKPEGDNITGAPLKRIANAALGITLTGITRSAFRAAFRASLDAPLTSITSTALETALDNVTSTDIIKCAVDGDEKGYDPSKLHCYSVPIDDNTLSHILLHYARNIGLYLLEHLRRAAAGKGKDSTW